MSVEFLFISSSNKVIRSGVDGNEMLQALLEAAIGGIEIGLLVVANNERF